MKCRKILSLGVGLCLMLALSASASAADYTFDGVDGTDYYGATNYESAYGSAYNYGGKNAVDFAIPDLPYGVVSNTSIGAMERVRVLDSNGYASATPLTGGGYGLPTDNAGGGSILIDGIGEVYDPSASAELPAQATLTIREAEYPLVYQKTAFTSTSGMTLKSTSELVKKDAQFEVPSATPEIKVPTEKAPGKAETIRVVNEPRYQYRIVKQPGQSLKKSIRGTDGISTKASRLGIKAPQKAVKTAEQTSRTTVKTAKATAKAAQRSAQASARAARASAQAAKASAKALTVTAKATVKAIAATIKAIATATKDLIAAIAAGGWIALVAIVLICLIGLIVASPFGIFFAGNNRDAGAVTVSAAVSQVNYDFNAQLEALQDDDYDSIDITGTMADWPEVLAVFAVKVAGNEDADAMDVATLDPERVGKLKEVFWDMNTITSEVETIEHPDSSPDDDADDSWTERNLHITISSKTAEEMKTEYNFSEKQKKMLDELLQNRDALLELIGNLEFISADAEEILKNLPDDLSDERREVVKTACSLVGKVGYFWGGKSLVIGWDQRWGTIQKVWAEGSSTTGTYRPYGLDCSGFVDWVFYNMSNGEYVIGHGGGAMSQHTYCNPITWDEAIPGDLVFYPEDSHVGIVGGWDQDGNILIIHCTSGGSLNGTVITGAYGFSSIGRPFYYVE